MISYDEGADGVSRVSLAMRKWLHASAEVQEGAIRVHLPVREVSGISDFDPTVLKSSIYNPAEKLTWNIGDTWLLVVHRLSLDTG